MSEDQKNTALKDAETEGVGAFLRRETLSWIGIGGAIVTLLTGLQDFIKLASWASMLVDNFAEITRWFWSKLFFFLPRLTPLAAWYLNLVTFFVTVALTSLRFGGGVAAPASSPVRDAFVGLGIAVTFGLAISSLLGLQASGSLAASDTDFIREVLTWLGFYLPKKMAFVAALLLVVLPLVLLMNILGWTARIFGGVTDQRLAVSRIWRINLGVALVLVLSVISKWLEPMCAPGGPLAWLCG